METCKVHVRKIFSGDDYNRVYSVEGKVPETAGMELVAAYTILDRAKIEKLIASGCEVVYEDIQDTPVKKPVDFNAPVQN